MLEWHLGGRVALVPVAVVPEGETLAGPTAAPYGDLSYTEGPFDFYLGTTLVTVRVGNDPFLVATNGSKRVWVVQNLPSAGGSDAGFLIRPRWSVFFMNQSRVGTHVYAAATGREVVSGEYNEPVMAPNTWVLLTPWFSPFSECYQRQSRTYRIALHPWWNGKRFEDAPKAHLVPMTEISEEERCGDYDKRETIGAVASNGAVYAIARRGIPGAGEGKTYGLIELFRVSDDKKIASLENEFPADHRQELRFSDSGLALVLREFDLDRKPISDHWYQIVSE